jgi:ribonuclease Z
VFLDEVHAVRGLLAVWVSHIHADHHLGLLAVLARRRQMGCGPLLVVGPCDVHSWLDEYVAFQPLDFVFVDAAGMCAPVDGATPLPADPYARCPLPPPVSAC